jgi:N-acetylglucosamine kinase-like BadF-type ATPase
MRHAIAVDGGNSKTDLALVREDGELVASARGPGSSPQHLGVDGALAVIEGLLDGMELPVEAAELLLAGVDFPSEEHAVRAAIEHRGWATRVSVDNDTFAVLRAGTDRGWGVAVVCGAGINCVGVAPDGRQQRFRALGWTTGDWGGGVDVGRDAVWAAARSEDGRGPKTELERLVPAHFGLATPSELAEAVHFGRIDGGRAIELAPVVFAAAADDAVAAAIVDHLAAEVVALARVAITRLGLEREPVEVILGGGLLRHPTASLLDAIERGLAEVGAWVTVHATSVPPILGAALLALDALGAEPEAYDRVRAALEVVPVG